MTLYLQPENKSELKHESSLQRIQNLVSGHDPDQGSSTPPPPLLKPS